MKQNHQHISFKILMTVLLGIFIFSINIAYAQDDLLASLTAEFEPEEEVSLVLTGVVLDKETLSPLSKTNIELIDVLSKQKEVFTSSDGNFFFKLMPDREYQVSVANQPNTAKKVSTAAKRQAEILHAILEVAAPKMSVPNSQPANWAQQESLATQLLVGRLLDKGSKQPLRGGLIELIDLTSYERQECISLQDGSFSFALKPNRNYQVAKIHKGKAEDLQNINTHQRTNDEQLNITLYGSVNTDLFWEYEEEDSEVAIHEVEPSKSTLKDGADMSNLQFKVQIAAFRKPESSTARFLKNLDTNHKLNIEKAPNNMIRYVVERFPSYQDAHAYCQILQDKGYQNAFVAAYVSGHRIEMPVEKVLELYYGE